MSDIRKDFTWGLFWSAVEKYSGLIMGVVISMILARLLSPSEYGIVAIASVMVSFFSMFSTMGIGPAIIQRNDLTKENLDDIFTFSAILGMALSLLFFGGASLLSRAYGMGDLIPVCRILSITLLFGSLNMVPNALMAKNKKFKQIAVRTFFLQFFSGVVSVFAAWYGAGVYALLISPIITSIGIFLYNKHYFSVHFRRNFSIEPIRRIFSYSSYQFLFELSNFFSRNLDKLIVGKSFSPDALGFYEKSYRLMQMPLNNVTSVISPVLQPILAQIQNDKKDIAKKNTKLIYCVSVISFPLGAYLYMSGAEVIKLMYGIKWVPAIKPFEILALSIPLQLILSTSGSVFQASNATKSLFKVGLKNSIKTIAAFVIGSCYFRTIDAVAWGWTIASIANFVETYLEMYHKTFGVSFVKMIFKLTIPFMNFVCVILGLHLISIFVCAENYVLSLMLKTMLAGIITFVFIFFFSPFGEKIKKTLCHG